MISKSMNCQNCVHNNVCIALRIADVVECEEFAPRCSACSEWVQINGSSRGECLYHAGWTGADDFCSFGEAINE